MIENKYAKIRFKSDNTWTTYSTTISKEPTKNGTYTIAEAWSGNGSTYYKVIRTSDDEIIQYELFRFSELYGMAQYYGDVLEIVYSTEDFPAEMKQTDSTYSILYAKQSGQIVRFILYIIFLVTAGVITTITGI